MSNASNTWSALVRTADKMFDAPEKRVHVFKGEVDYDVAEEHFEADADHRDEIVFWIEPGDVPYQTLCANYGDAFYNDHAG